MSTEAQLPLATFLESDLAPFVAQVVGKQDCEVVEWQVQRLSGGGSDYAGGGLGVYRLSGFARTDGQMLPWALIVKVASGSNPTGSVDPAEWNYWKREVLAYRSGILNELPSNHLVAPRCYGVTEHANAEWRIWLEDIQEMPATWTLARHGIAARHLGQFNGAYLAGHPLPAPAPWLWRGRMQNWLSLCEGLMGDFQTYTHSALGRRWLTPHSVERMLKLWANRQTVLQLVDRLPVCLCHHDAFRRNLLARDGTNSTPQTIAIDWAYIGYGGVGQDVGLTTAINLSWMEVASHLAKELDCVIFESYLDGLHDAGWQGDVRLARFGYTATAAMVTGVCYAIAAGTMLATPEGIAMQATIVGQPFDEIVEQWAVTQPFLLDLGDEALQLMAVIG